MEIEELIAGKTISKALNEQLTHNEIRWNVNDIWSLLYMTGYLTIAQKPSGGNYPLRIPIVRCGRSLRSRCWNGLTIRRAETDKLSDLYAAFETGDAAAITDFPNSQLLDTASFYDAHESFYYGFLLALLSTCANWRVPAMRRPEKAAATSPWSARTERSAL